MPVSLHVVDGPDRGRLFTLRGSVVTLGRNADNTIVLNDIAVSGTHSRIVRSAHGGYTIHDNESTNGTLVNGVEQRAWHLRHGDIVQLGGTVFAFEIHPGNGILVLPGQASDEGAVIGDEEESAALPLRIEMPPLPEGLDRSQLERRYASSLLLERLDKMLTDLDSANEMLGVSLDAALVATGSRKGVILLVDERTGEVVPSVMRNLAGDVIEVSFSKSLAFDVILSGKGQLRQVQNGAGPHPVLCAPLLAPGRTVGAIHLSDRAGGEWSREDLEFVERLGRRAGTAMAAARLRVDVELLFSSMIDAIMRTIQAKDVYTRGHSERVRHYSKILARELGMSREEVKRVALGGALHDIGKIGMPDSILHNTTPLTPEQLEEVKKHPVRGAKMLADIPFLKEVVPATELHHEDWGTGGYPYGIGGEEIPLIARIVAVADTFDAVTTDRPYQKGHSYDEGLQILRRLKGKRLEGDLVEAFVQAWYKTRRGPQVTTSDLEPVTQAALLADRAAPEIDDVMRQTILIG